MPASMLPLLCLPGRKYAWSKSAGRLTGGRLTGLGEPVKRSGNHHVQGDRAAFLRALRAPDKRRCQRRGDAAPS